MQGSRADHATACAAGGEERERTRRRRQGCSESGVPKFVGAGEEGRWGAAELDGAHGCAQWLARWRGEASTRRRRRDEEEAARENEEGTESTEKSEHPEFAWQKYSAASPNTKV